MRATSYQRGCPEFIFQRSEGPESGKQTAAKMDFFEDEKTWGFIYSFDSIIQ